MGGGQLLYSQEIYVRSMAWLYKHVPQCIRPNHVTIMSLVLGLLTGLLFMYGHFIWGIILLQISVAGDRLDGQIARNRNMVSKFGWWLDSFSDRLVDFVVLFGLGWATGMYFIALLVMGAHYLIIYTYLSVRWNVEHKLEDSVYKSRIKKIFAYSRTNIYLLLIPFVIIGNIPMYLYAMLFYSWVFYAMLIIYFTIKIRRLY